ncbi:MAG: bifunctional [glutamate--ammonia ligase]-adenylyl-L-tyrosine phosphorylase/[glutamate--ammonia-ligase] adenylyltransferase [Pseudomonadota bacterium]|nr:bifunctional [glutamate--ammonia ligase]-adenylyl-L-tyrosine phosphorylase/[glutamate--ammonia-ligase] adenylyltransferase [Pseudomonadota bacterium]
MNPAEPPPLLRPESERYWEQLHPALCPGPDPGLCQALRQVCACSPFVACHFARDPSRLAELLASGELGRRLTAAEYRARAEAASAGAEDEAALMSRLRRLRHRELVRIAWRDIRGDAGLADTMAELSDFADAVLAATLGWLHRAQVAALGSPCDGTGALQTLIVLAMGKLGAQELNFSSDIDLILCYPAEGETRGGPGTLSNQAFFERQGQRLIRALSEVTADGFVFRVDMRLRPFGDAGPLVMSFDALERYYEAHGRDWERYALIKARPAAGDAAAGQRLVARLLPFVYRRYLDFGAIGALREMKRLIDEEVKRKGLASNIKQGPGGIREIEFIGQTFQLIHGGRRPILRARPILEVLEHLARLGHLPAAAVADLSGAYAFLRTTEHRLQEIDDRQTQALPERDVPRARIAYGMGYPDWAAFLAALDAHRERVQHHFNRLVLRPEAPDGAPWQPRQGTAERVSRLAALGFTDPDPALRALDTLYASAAVRRLTPVERERLDRVLPALLAATARLREPATTLGRVLAIVEAIAKRSVYLILLEEHPAALRQLVELCAASPWIASYLARQPVLLDELIDPRTLYAPPTARELTAALAAQLSHVSPGDLEQEMDALRHFKHAQFLRVAAADVAGILPVPAVSDHLSAIAETVLKSALALAQRDLELRHGPETAAGAFAVVAYGKLGGIELGYGSDLDLVFLYEGPAALQERYTRLAQRIIHLLATVTPAGKVFDVDTRLRPSGASGLLVSSLSAYREYQTHDAWTWEHQALVRARVVGGDSHAVQRFSSIRTETLARVRDGAELRREVREMRAHMRAELENRTPGGFDLKQGEGGLTDIEFLVQYAVLRWAASRPVLATHTENCRLLAILGDTGVLTRDDAAALTEANFAYRKRLHALALAERPALVGERELEPERARVGALWRRLLEQ